ncbi:MAG: hypothetical protein WC755_00220 [Candidatus Woesearchaeota archaeon]|jgi:hypothetical protein
MSTYNILQNNFKTFGVSDIAISEDFENCLGLILYDVNRNTLSLGHIYQYNKLDFNAESALDIMIRDMTQNQNCNEKNMKAYLIGELENHEKSAHIINELRKKNIQICKEVLGGEYLKDIKVYNGKIEIIFKKKIRLSDRYEDVIIKVEEIKL